MPALQAKQKKRRPAGLIAGIAAAALLAAALLGVYHWKLSAPGLPPSSDKWDQLTFFNDNAVYPAVSSDGRMLAFLRGSDSFMGKGEVYVKLLPTGTAVALTHDGKGKLSPAFSPDNSSIAYGIYDPWETWQVPVLGGDAQLLLANASSLAWIENGRRLLFSETRNGMHMVLVTTDLSRGDSRDVYVPPGERGMVHHSYLSPDGKSVLIVQMDNSGNIVPCQVVPFDGKGGPVTVGPAGAACYSGAWSADGRWIYLSVDTGESHLWRQRYPGGRAQQITFGPTTQSGVVLSPEGRSLFTSVGTESDSIWLHDAAGDNAVLTEGDAYSPQASRDGATLYFTVRNAQQSSYDLWARDMATGSLHKIASNVAEDARVSPDGRQLLYSAAANGNHQGIWIAPVNHRSSPVLLTENNRADAPLFLPDGSIVFRQNEGGANYMMHMAQDGSAARRLSNARIQDFPGSSDATGRWVLATAPQKDENYSVALYAFPVSGGEPQRLCYSFCRVWFSPEGTAAYLQGADEHVVHVLKVDPATGLPVLPPGGVSGPEALKNLQPTLPVDQTLFCPGAGWCVRLSESRISQQYFSDSIAVKALCRRDFPGGAKHACHWSGCR